MTKEEIKKYLEACGLSKTNIETILSNEEYIKLLNSYLGKRKIDIVITNSEKVSKKIQRKYETLEQKDLVKIDDKNIDIVNIKKPFLKIENDVIRHDSIKLGLEIMNILIK